ncbi:MYCBP-associated protein isoform X2 [Poeciliopsis prolifica]|uniref:MYCBP-associated protein isoform X2 n=1 Tax=Poeciliopsis prolifica TaxID=188132 RepID=UPI0024139604|nr:MYCBP-associated protein isoform X2 [Poeciliopsis prolifica]
MQEESTRSDDPDATNAAGSFQSSCPQCSEQILKPKPPKSNPSFLEDLFTTCKLLENFASAEAEVLNEDGNAKESQHVDFSEYLRFDEHGMILPHSILGSLDDFRTYLEARGEKHLLKHFPKPLTDPASEANMEPRTESRDEEISHQSNALQNWDKHMSYRRRKQKELSDSLNWPVENLLMNQDKHYRETTEQKEILNQVMPLVYPGYGYTVGGEFWSLPQRLGDELTGIATTLTRTERGLKKPITHVGHPDTIHREMGIVSTEIERPATQAWAQSAYLQHKTQELGQIVHDVDIKNLDMSKLEVIGTGKPHTSVSEHQDPLLQNEKKEKKEHLVMEEEEFDRDSLEETDDDQVQALPYPALRINGQLAEWTGHPTSDEGAVGLCTSVLFKTQTGEIVSTNLELRNEGNTVIFYSWKKLPRQLSLSHLYQQKNRVRFYFRSSSGVIHPSETQQVEFIFKSEEQGLWTEIWQLNTHPVLLQGASIQVRLSGVAIKLDKTADLRRFLENKLEKIAVEKYCRSILNSLVRGVYIPERPKSPAELYLTEEQQFQNKNPVLQYHFQPVEALKTLWQQVNPDCSWDLCFNTLRQAVLSLPDEDPIKEESFSQLNSLYLQLCDPPAGKHHLVTPAITGRQLWINLLDLMGTDAVMLRAMMDLPEKDTWSDEGTPSPTEDRRESSDVIQKCVRIKLKDVGRTDSREFDSPIEITGTKGRRTNQAGKHSKDKHPKEFESPAECSSNLDLADVDEETLLTYRGDLHKMVYVWMEELVCNLCDQLDDMEVGDGQTPKCCA